MDAKKGGTTKATTATAHPPATSPTYAAAAAHKPMGAGGGGGSAPIVTALKSVPCTMQFLPAGPGLANAIPAPHVPRAAGGAVSAEKPQPQPAASEAEAQMTPLQSHSASFFDADGDGLIFASDTFSGFRAIGFNWLLSLVAVWVIHGTFAFWTAPSLLAFSRDLFRGAPLHVSRMDRGLHGSHTGVYDTEGRYRPEVFESIFTKFGDGRGGITWSGILTMLGRQRSIFDPMGMTAAFLEWGALYWLCGYDEGVLMKEDVRAMYDGTLWDKLAQRTAARRGHGYGGGHVRGGGYARPHAA
jgi:hypothetical protein